MHRLTRPLAIVALLIAAAGMAAIVHADTIRFRLRFSVAPHDGIYSLGAGDVNGDGMPDVIVPDGGHAQVISGSDGRTLFTLSIPVPNAFGFLMSSFAVGDLNADGESEIIVGLPYACSSGRVYVFSGSTGQVQFSMKSPSLPSDCNVGVGGGFGESVALIGAPGGGSDVVVGSPVEAAGRGSVFVFSGSTHALLRTLTAPPQIADSGFGGNVVAASGEAGSVLAVASFGQTIGGSPQPGRVYVFTTQATPDFVLDNPNPGQYQVFGRAIALQIDRRGEPRLAVGELTVPGYAQGQVFVFSGAKLLYKLTTPNPQPFSAFGISVAFTGPDGSSTSLLVGAPGETVNGSADAGRLYAFNVRGKLTASLTSPNPQTDDVFGRLLIVSHGTCSTALVVGVPRVDSSNGRVEYFAPRGNPHPGERCPSRGSITALAGRD